MRLMHIHRKLAAEVREALGCEDLGDIIILVESPDGSDGPVELLMLRDHEEDWRTVGMLAVAREKLIRRIASD